VLLGRILEFIAVLRQSLINDVVGTLGEEKDTSIVFALHDDAHALSSRRELQRVENGVRHVLRPRSPVIECFFLNRDCRCRTMLEEEAEALCRDDERKFIRALRLINDFRRHRISFRNNRLTNAEYTEKTATNVSV